MKKVHKNPGNFANNPKAAAAAGRNGGKVSPGNFKNDPRRAASAGRVSGRARALKRGVAA